MCSEVLERTSIPFCFCGFVANTIVTDTTTNRVGTRLPKPRKMIVIFLFLLSPTVERR